MIVRKNIVDQQNADESECNFGPSIFIDVEVEDINCAVWSHATRRSLATNRTCTFESRFLSTSLFDIGIS